MYRRRGNQARKLIIGTAAAALLGSAFAVSTGMSQAADLLYHLLVLLQASGVGPEEIGQELLRRHGFVPSRHSDMEAQTDRSADA